VSCSTHFKPEAETADPLPAYAFRFLSTVNPQLPLVLTEPASQNTAKEYMVKLMQMFCARGRKTSIETRKKYKTQEAR
jgi:hypothetical protein